MIMKYKYKYLYFLFLFFFLLEKNYALDLQGNYIQGGLVFGKLDNRAKVFLDNKNIPVDEHGNFVLGFKRKHKPQSIIKVAYESGNTILRTVKINKRKYKIQKINNLDKKKVTPPKSYYERIKREIALIKKSKEVFYNYPYYQVGFIMPVEGIITGVYGSQRILNGEAKRPHYGIDIANIEGTEVISPSDGVIVLAEKDLFFSGGTIIISHGMGLTSSLLHLSEIFVSVGDKAEIGEKAGSVGSTGRSTGPHLDWRMEVRGTRVDPQLLIN